MTGAILVPGSYDPVTLGHLSVIATAAGMAEMVYVVIFVNPEKECHFPTERRLDFLRAACAKFPNVRVSYDGGMVADFAAVYGVSFILKGIRDERDFLYERAMADYNRANGIETVFLPSSPELRGISSTEVRRRIDAGEPLDGLLPAEVINLL